MSRDNILLVLIIWFVCMFIGLWMRAQERDELTLGDLVFAICFGPLYMISGFHSWDATIWKRGKK